MQMVARNFLASVSLDDLRMMQKVFNGLRREFGYAPESQKALRLTIDLINELKAGTVPEDRLREKLKSACLLS